MVKTSTHPQLIRLYYGLVLCFACANYESVYFFVYVVV
jgi:hypothetical protein